MIALVFAALASIVLLFSGIWILLRKCHKSLPPGPAGIPLVGNLIQLMWGGQMHATLGRWALKYGKIYTMHLSGNTIFVLNDVSAMKHVLGGMAATGRLRVPILNMLTWSGEYGILSTSGKVWLEQNHFFTGTLAQFGFGRPGRMKKLVLAEAKNLCGWIDGENEQGKENIILNDAIDQCTGNLMWSMITGHKMHGKECKKITDSIAEFMALVPKSYNLDFMRLFKYIIPSIYSGYKRVVDLSTEIQEYFELKFKDHAKTIGRRAPPRNVIDAYNGKVGNCQNIRSSFFGENGKRHGYAATLNILMGGRDTTGATLTWVIFYLSVHSQVQRQLQMEIDSVIGRVREPALEDKEKMPFMEAVILEALRFSSLVASGGMVTLLEDVKFEEYLLPRGTIVVANLHFIHNDKKIWGDPENFRPARFLEEHGKHLKSFVIAFRPGKRACPGERFARNIIFLLVAKLFQTFDFDVDSSIKNTKDYLEPECGEVLKAKKLPLVVTRRE